MSMAVSRSAGKKLAPSAAPLGDALGDAERKAAITKKKAREAKASLKQAKKLWKTARKAARAARKELAALQEDIASANEEAASAQKKSRVLEHRAAKKASPTAEANQSKRRVSATGRLQTPARRKRVRAASKDSSAGRDAESVSGRGGAEPNQDEAAPASSVKAVPDDSAVQEDDSTPVPRSSGS
jgi:chromosome segregation ATPase